ncbi:MAG: hypothetical protein JJU36_14190, partial [Phycisphaeraceae bacterium]|nr:hypothetical protein [Phycisphaeraceae bacterium]
MRISDTKLIERYLEGELGADETAQLRQRIDADPDVLDALVMEAYELESLREALNADVVTVAALASDPRPTHRRPVVLAIAAAVAVVACAGWVAAWMSHHSMIEVQQELASLRSQISQGQVDTSQAESSTATNAARPLTISRRGLLLALADRGHPAHSIAIGHEVPLERRLWTCPWGAAEFRFSDGLA